MIHYENQFMDCYVSLRNGRLTIGNSQMERVWNMQEKLPVPISMRNKQSGKEWYTAEENSQWVKQPPQKYAFFKNGITEGEMRVMNAETKIDNDLNLAQEHLQVVIRLEFTNFYVNWIHLVYPGQPFQRIFLQAISKKTIQSLPDLELHAEWPIDYTDCSPLAPLHSRWKNVCFYDRTDDYDNLVITTKGMNTRGESRVLEGNLLFSEDYLGKEGVLLVKEGPTPLGYQNNAYGDFRIQGMSLFTLNWGFEGTDCSQAGSLTSYGCAIILWEGEEDQAYRNLHRYQRALRRFEPNRDAQIMANTWGDGSADGRISEAFLMSELRRAKELGIDFYQIDDGWQQGTTGNSVNAAAVAEKNNGEVIWGEGYYKADPQFWSVNKERLPNGLEPIVSYAKESGIRLGLWFSPDSENFYQNWERDSDTLLRLHRKYGIQVFKIDGVRLRSKLGEENFIRILHRVVKESNGKVFFNLDTTAETRNGHFGRVQYGSLFLENRFTNRFGNWPNYWPHMTLRNLWNLSRYIPTERLQIEFLNVYRNEALYENDPFAPAVCGMEYAFAVSMFANPLAWMELTNLNDHAMGALKKVFPIYHRVQADILAGFVQPIGEEPDGIVWTGFHSKKEDNTGYLLILREADCKDHYTYRLPSIKNMRLRLEPVLGSGTQREVSADENGGLEFRLDKPFSYALYRYAAIIDDPIE